MNSSTSSLKSKASKKNTRLDPGAARKQYQGFLLTGRPVRGKLLKLHSESDRIMRNLTFDFMRDHMRAARDAAVNAIPEYETVLTYTNKLDPKTGKIMLDGDGIPTLVEKRLLKRAVVAAEWADKLKPHEDAAHDRY